MTIKSLYGFCVKQYLFPALLPIVSLTLFFALPALATPGEKETGVNLEIVIEGIPNNSGSVRIAVFSELESALFPDDVPLLKHIVAANDQGITFNFNNLAAGRYAALVFHDENGNEILDRNFFGIPKEYWGVSGKRPFGSNPRYVNSIFVLDSEHNKITILLGN